ncbi:Phosphotransferase system, phosphocarrier protein HPr [Planctomycetales bacterium 10988]|nr:Phosphotransferase system, phosphocarrier protein HPr [Planctomycetales bacterium 10988]
MSSIKVTRHVQVVNKVGLHVRAGGKFVQVAKPFDAEIEVKANGMTANGLSILDLLSLGAQQGTDLTIEASGPDAEAAADALVQLVADGFHEDDASKSAILTESPTSIQQDGKAQE